MSRLILARKAVLSKRDNSTLEIQGEWAFLMEDSVKEQNAEGLRMCNREYLGFEIHPESDKFVFANESNPESLGVDKEGNYFIKETKGKVIGAEGKPFNDEELANRIASENKLIEEKNALLKEIEALKAKVKPEPEILMSAPKADKNIEKGGK